MKNKVLNNASWIIGCKIVQSLLNLAVGMITARFLGPSNYGLINYAAAIVGFVAPLMRLGLESILVQDITNDPENERTTLGTALGLNIPSSLLCVLAIIGFVFCANSGEKDTLIVCSIYSVSLVFQATEMITYWYQAKLLSKFPSIAMLVAHICISLYKIYLLVTHKNVYWFAFSNALDHLIISAILLVLYFVFSKQRLKFSSITAKQMLSKSKFYIISGIMINVFQQADRLMLKNMVGDEVTGFYSAAVTCAGIFGFVYAAVIDSARPEILKNKVESNDKYEKNLACLYSIVFYSSLLQCLVTTLFAKPLILLLYGSEYLPAVNALRIIVWFVTYSYFGVIRSIWILGEEKHKYVIWIDVSGAVLNVVLNALLIPSIGLIGAAIASLATQIFMNFIVGFFIKPLRRNNEIMLQGINPKFALEFIIVLLHKVRGK